LSFPQVMDIAAKLLPLKYASYEREYPDARIAVSDIRLGYMRVLQRAHPRQFYLILAARPLPGPKTQALP